jgi:uncharacterized protein (TIGR02301 family)
LALLLLGSGLSAHAQTPVKRPPNTDRTLERLADAMGAVHYLNVVCEGRKRQDWRDRMVELLELEQPDYYLRSRLIGAFNRGYQEQERMFPACSDALKSEISQQIQLKAKQGRILSDALADPYLH